jgi:hypothetical protein
MAKFNTGQSFADGDQVTGAKLNNIVGLLDIYSGVIADQTAIAATVSTADLLLIADTDAGSSGAANKVTIQKLLNDTLTGGTFTNANIAEQLTYGTATGNRTVSTSAVITNGTIGNSTLGTTTGTLATITNLTAGTTTSTAANITNGTIQTLTASTATITGGTYSGAINSTTGTIATLNSTTGTIANLISTTGTVATLNSTTGTITNLSTTLAGDFTISQGTGTIGAAKVTPANLSQPLTSGVQVATGGTAVEFTSIPSWVKKLTVMLNGVSTNGTSPLQLQLGSTTYSTSGYNSFAWSANTFNSSSTSGLILQGTNADGSITSGNLTVCTLGSNTWVSSHSLGATSNNNSTGGGAITLGGSLDRLRLTTVGGTQTFDAGTINIIYQG